MLNRGYHTLLIAIALLLLSGCNLPASNTPPASDLEATAVQQTVEAINSQQNTTNNQNSNLPPSQNAPQPSNTAQSQNNAASQSSPTPQPTSTQQPTPTTQSPQPQSNNQASQPLTLGTISQILAEIGYGNCNGLPSILGASLTVEPKSEVSSVIVWYEINSQNGGWGPYWKNMSYTQGVEYYAEIDMNVDGPGTLGNTGGWINYWVEATAKDGTSYTSPYYSMNVVYCPQNVLPPAARLPVINFFSAPAQVAPNEDVVVSWEVFDAACGVYLDGMVVGASDGYSYTVPAQGAPAEYAHQLVAQGEPCNNPTIVTADLTIQVSQPQKPAAPSNFSFDSWGPGPTALFTWNDNSNNETGFHIWDSSGIVATLGANTTSWQLELIGFCNFAIQYQISAFNTNGDSDRIYMSKISGLCPPAPPTIVKNSAFDTTSDFYITLYGIASAFNIYVDGALWRENSSLTNHDYPIACGETVWLYATGLNYAGESDPSNYIKIVGTCP